MDVSQFMYHNTSKEATYPENASSLPGREIIPVTNIKGETSDDGYYPEQCLLGLSKDVLLKSVWVILAFLVLILVTVFGNLLIILSILCEPKLQSLGNMLYVSLAPADMLVGLLVMPPMLLYTLYGCWPLGALMCDLWVSVDGTCSSASFLSLCVIAADRYYAIANPFEHMKKQSIKRIRLKILAVWLASALAWVPAIFINRVMTGETQTNHCDLPLSSNYGLWLTVCIVVYHIPIVIMVTFFILLLNAIHRQLSSSIKVKDPVSVISVGSECETDPNAGSHHSSAESKTRNYGNQLEENRKLQEEKVRIMKEKRAVRTLAVIMGAFLLCWGWWVIIWPVDGFIPGIVPGWLYDLAAWAAYINSGVNPFLFVFSNRDFRMAVKNILCTCRCLRN